MKRRKRESKNMLSAVTTTLKEKVQNANKKRQG